MTNKVLEAWYEFASTKNSELFKNVLADNVCFHSPVVHTPQVGRDITLLYLESAHDVLANSSFSYQRELVGEFDAVLEFNAEVKGILVNGVDMISWNKEGKITEFKVMLRPLKAINIIHQEMGARLQAAAGRSAT